MALTDKLTAIADAIRGKTGKSDSMTLDQMPTEIAGIQAGGGGGISGIKFVDEDITVEESTDTEVTYTIDGVQVPVLTENPNKWTTYTSNEVYLVFITPKEVAGEYTASDKATSSALVMFVGHTNYTIINTKFSGYYGGGQGAIKAGYSSFGAGLNIISAVTDGVVISSAYVKVKTTNGYIVPAGTYNVQFWMLTDFNWGM